MARLARRSSSFVVPRASERYFSTSSCRASIAHDASASARALATRRDVSSRASRSRRSAVSRRSRHSRASDSRRRSATPCARSYPEKGAPEPGPGSATTTPRDAEPPPRPSFSLAAPLGGVAGRAPPRGWGDAGGVGLCVCAASSMSVEETGVEETGAGDPAACSASRRRARMASSCAESATMAPSLARAGACDASFFRSNARGASGDATRSATGVAASVARVAGERVSTLGRDDDAPRDAFVPSDVSADPVLGSRPEGLRGGVPAAELGRPRRGDP